MTEVGYTKAQITCIDYVSGVSNATSSLVDIAQCLANHSVYSVHRLHVLQHFIERASYMYQQFSTEG